MKCKYETHVAPYLDQIVEWAKAGATEKEIADHLNVAYSTFRKYLALGEKGDKRYAAFSEAFAQACEVPDNHVENALYKRACGFEYVEVKKEQKLDRAGNVLELVTTTNKVVPPDPTSAMFWLTNRRRDRWRYRPDGEKDDLGDEKGGVVILPDVDGGQDDAHKRGACSRDGGQNATT